MSKYTEEFKRKAIEHMKNVGVTKASSDLKIAHCTIYRWCRELEGTSEAETEGPVPYHNEANEVMDEESCTELAAAKPDETQNQQDESGGESEAGNDTIATAMALLVIENTHLREVIKHLRDTISGLTDHRLL